MAPLADLSASPSHSPVGPPPLSPRKAATAAAAAEGEEPVGAKGAEGGLGRMLASAKESWEAQGGEFEGS